VSSISGSIVNTTFTVACPRGGVAEPPGNANGNQTAGNGLTLTYAAFNKPATIARGSARISFAHDSEHQRFKRMSPTGKTLYLAGSGVMAERLLGTGGVVQWTNYLSAGGEMIGMRVDRSDATTYTRFFHKDHLGSIATITNATGAVVERLSYDAWGKRRFPNGQDDPLGSIASETTRGFTGHEQLAEVGLIHMNGRVYDPMLGRFGTPDPETENPFSTQGWNRYSYVGNSPLNFTDPSGYCFAGCFWQGPFKALGAAIRRTPILGNILQVAATAICLGAGGGPACAPLASAAVTGLASGDIGQALKAGAIAAATAAVSNVVGDLTGGFAGTLDLILKGHGPLEFLSDAHLFNIAGHAAVGCGSAVASDGKCGPGALSGAAGSFAGPLANDMNRAGKLFVDSTAGGLASVAGGGKFGNGAVTAAFGYL
jgi:RHS repeat-associated protein